MYCLLPSDNFKNEVVTLGSSGRTYFILMFHPLGYERVYLYFMYLELIVNATLAELDVMPL